MGLERWRRRKIRLGFQQAAPDGDTLPFQGSIFRRSDQTRQRTICESVSEQDILAWIVDAKGLSDTVVLSVHSHEQGASDELPPEFFRAFAVKAIEAGADIVVGHGPHLLRGMEIYRGRPIFYSLGNFIGQNELIARLPSESYRRFGVDAKTKTGAACRARNEGDTKGFPADVRYWQTVVPICKMIGGRLASVEVHPVTLDVHLPRHHRGRPRLAKGAEASEILRKFVAMSENVECSIDGLEDKATITAVL